MIHFCLTGFLTDLLNIYVKITLSSPDDFTNQIMILMSLQFCEKVFAPFPEFPESFIKGIKK